MHIREIELAETCDKLPSIQKYESKNGTEQRTDDLLICCCGFDERSLALPYRLSSDDTYKAQHSLILTHETNQIDNEANRPKLVQTMTQLTLEEQHDLLFRQEDFTSKFEALLDNVLKSSLPMVSLDISGCSTQMILSALKVLFERRVSLRVLYAEADVYHPTNEEYQARPDDWIVDGKGASTGILRATESRLYPGVSNKELPNLLVAFPTFKPERIRSIQLELQPSATIWVLGIPHARENSWREQAEREINKIEQDARVERVSTFTYVDSFSAMERLYRETKETHHMTIAPHGSKLQCIGVSLFCLLRQDVSLWFSVPKSFNPSQYTGGVKDLWEIDFGDTSQVVTTIRACGKLEFRPD